MTSARLAAARKQREDNELLARVQAYLDVHESKPRGELLAAIAIILMLVGVFAVLHLS